MNTRTCINLVAAFGLLVASFRVIPVPQSVSQAAIIVRVMSGDSTSAICDSIWTYLMKYLAVIDCLDLDNQVVWDFCAHNGERRYSNEKDICVGYHFECGSVPISQGGKC